MCTDDSKNYVRCVRAGSMRPGVHCGHSGNVLGRQMPQPPSPLAAPTQGFSEKVGAQVILMGCPHWKRVLKKTANMRLFKNTKVMTDREPWGKILVRTRERWDRHGPVWIWEILKSCEDIGG